jgi:hypothetical protein
VQDGNPCSGASNCCTRLCVDPGSGVKVCQPAGGCRMTGDYCDSTASCCNINDQVATSQQIQCDAEHTCDNGGACNPPGNICGASTDVNASQNCCMPSSWTGSGKPACKQDSNGISRCYGAPPGSTNTSCPTGYDANDPNCCIAQGNVCQFRDQCCGGTPCVPDATGVLRCGGTCIAQDGACTSNADCCSGTCTGGKCVAPACKAPGLACDPALNPTDCCSGSCDPDSKTCVRYCQQQSQACTVSADCCFGLSCNIQPGATAGTCQSAPAACADLNQSCGGTVTCCEGLTCNTSGACVSAATCIDVSQHCAAGGTGTAACCSGLSCETITSSGSQTACTAGDTSCTCEVPAATCVHYVTGQTPLPSCSPTQPCCPGENTNCLDATGNVCTSATGCACTPPPTCSKVNQACSPTQLCCNGAACVGPGYVACDGSTACSCVNAL